MRGLDFDIHGRRLVVFHDGLSLLALVANAACLYLLCVRWFHTAERTLEGVEAAHMMRKGQVKRLDGRDAAGQVKFVASLFGVAA